MNGWRCFAKCQWELKKLAVWRAGGKACLRRIQMAERNETQTSKVGANSRRLSARNNAAERSQSADDQARR